MLETKMQGIISRGNFILRSSLKLVRHKIRWVSRSCVEPPSAHFKHHSLLFRNKPMSVIFAMLSPSSNEVTCKVVACVVITCHDVERVAVDLDVSTDCHVAWSDPGVIVIDVLVPIAVKELALDDTRVLLGRFVDRDAVISQVERNDEAAVNIFWHARIETSCKSEDLFVVVNTLEEVALWFFRDELVDVAKCVFLISDSIVWWDLGWDGFWRSWELNLSEREIIAILLRIELFGGCVDTFNLEDAAKSIDITVWCDLIAGQVVVSNEGLSWLVHIKAVWKFLSTEEEGESVATIVGVMNLTDLNGVIGQIVVYYEWKIVTTGKEAKHMAIVIQELLLRSNFASTKSLLKELFHLRVSLWWYFNE